jgi:hypothetical protein
MKKSVGEVVGEVLFGADEVLLRRESRTYSKSSSLARATAWVRLCTPSLA